MKLGSLFDGIAGFPLAASRYGIEPMWASEIEPFPISVSQRHFPTMKHLGSVTDIGLCIDVRGPEVEWYFSDSQGERVENTDVDIVSFGSPCQDLSVAGKRAGLSGRRSNLFYQAVRVIHDIQDATAGKYPRFVLWENVTGAFSSNAGRDFAAVLESLVGAAVSVPEKGWPGAGVVFGSKGQLAYRTFDAQYWGVPQRRRRIFALMHFAGERAGEILFVEPSLSGHPAESGEEREATAAGAGDGVEGAGRTWAIRTAQTSSNGWGITEETSYTLDLASGQAVAQCVTTGTGRRYDPETETLVVGCLNAADADKWFCNNQAVDAGHIIPVTLDGNDKARCLTARGDSSPCVDRGQNVVGVAQPIVLENHPHDSRVKVDESGKIQTLTKQMGTGGGNVPMLMDIVSIGFNGDQSDKTRSMGEAMEQCPTLRAGGATHVAFGPGGQHDIAHALRAQPSKADKPSSTTYVMEPVAFDARQDPVFGNVPGALDTDGGTQAVAFPEPANTLLAKASMSHRGDTDNVVVSGYAVRRLTPTECLRLMGFPDSWFDGIPGNSDTACYKACGNSVAIPCVEFIMRRIVECASS